MKQENLNFVPMGFETRELMIQRLQHFLVLQT